MTQPDSFTVEAIRSGGFAVNESEQNPYRLMPADRLGEMTGGCYYNRCLFT